MKTRAIFVSLLMLLLSATVLWAEDDPPGRVARLQYVSGSVSVQPQGTQDWVEAAVNRPLTSSDNIWADKNSRAELSIGTGIFRMNSETSVTFANLNDRTIQVQLHQGTLSLHLRKLYDGEIYEIDTPNMAFTVQKSGEYRFDVDPESDASTVTVWKGKGDATGEGPAVRVEAKERARFTDGTSLAHTFAPAPDLDGFDDWGIVRNQREDRYASGHYVSPDVIGADDLDEYGTWRSVPEYGAIWVPTHVVAGWAPYRYGHWVWINPWGWTWVDDAPWGFAPFHYGRWISYSGYWGWAPGPVYVRPVYAPALVTWFGGHGWGVSVGFGGGPAYGWCPLGYGEPFVPWYRGSRNYFRNVNIHNTRITNITNVTNIYYDRRGTPNHFANMRGATAVPEHAMLNSRPVAGSMLRVSERDFARAPHDRELNLTPTRTTMLGSNAGRPAALPPQRTFSRPVMSSGGRAPVAGGGREGSFNSNRPESGRMEGGRTPEQHEAQGPVNHGNFGGNAPMRNVPRPPDATLHSGVGRNMHVPEQNSPHSGETMNNNPERGTGDRGGFSRPAGNSNVPRPPDATLHSGAERNMRMQPPSSPRSGATVNGSPDSVDRGNFSRPPETTNAPHPPANNNNGGGNEHMNTPHREAPVNTPRSGGMDHSAPVSRPPTNERNAAPPANNNNGRGEQRPASPRNFRQSDGGPRSMNVPRPTGPVRQASNQSYDYRSSQANHGYSAPDHGGYNQSPRSYSSYDRGSSSQSERSYGSYGSGQRSYPSSPRSSTPSMSGNSQRSGQGQSPSYRSAPSSHSGYSGRSNGGGGGGHARGGRG